MSYCYELFKTSQDEDTRSNAVELLRVVADHRALPWISEFMADHNEGVQLWGAGVLDQLLWSGLVQPEDAESLIQIAEVHPKESVRERAEFIRGFLKDRSK